MMHGRPAMRRRFGLELLETRWLPSGGGGHHNKHHANHVSSQSKADVFVAKLTPQQVVLPQDLGNPTQEGTLGDPAQIQGGGGVALFPTPIPGDPAKGEVTFTITDAGKEIKVTGSLSHISNVSAVTLHDMNYPAAFPLRGTTYSPMTQPPALQPDTPMIPATTSLTSTQTMVKPPTNSTTMSSSTTLTQVTAASTNASTPSPITTTETSTAITSPTVNLPGGSTETTTTTTQLTSSAPTPSTAPSVPAPSSGPIYYSPNTVNTAQSTETGQILSSNFSQTVALLLNPGNGSGPVPPHATFQTVIQPQLLEGPLATAGGFAKLVHDMRKGQLYVLVQTNDGYDLPTGAQQDGNYPNGELRGIVE
jgi:hypothetical protein